MPEGYEVLVGMTLVSAVMSFFVVMFGGRSISYRAIGASELRKDLTEFMVSWAGVMWFCALPMTLAAPLFVTVPLFMQFAEDVEPGIRITILVHILLIPGLTGLASLLAGSDENVEV